MTKSLASKNVSNVLSNV